MSPRRHLQSLQTLNYVILIPYYSCYYYRRHQRLANFCAEALQCNAGEGAFVLHLYAVFRGVKLFILKEYFPYVKRSDIRICILRIEGTNCEDETKRGFDKLGVKAEIKHLKELKELFDYHILILPGGFSAGDYVASGAIMAARIRAKFYDSLKDFIREGRIIGGICNGFQVLMNLNLLDVEAALTTNMSARFECVPVFIRKEKDCAFTEETDKLLCLPVAHAEGRLIGRIDEEQIVFRYAKPDGSLAEGEYPYNPNGSQDDIAAICSREGNVFGMMPHPERVLEHVNQHDWTRKAPGVEGEGMQIFRSVVDYAERKL